MSQVRLDPDVTEHVDAERGDESRTAFVNGLLRDTFAAWETDDVIERAEPRRAIRRRSRYSMVRVRPMPRRHP